MAHTMTDGRLCGQALIAALEAYGVDTVFGIPGVHTQELYRGLSTSHIRHVLVRNEQGAGFMADGYARASGRPGVCVVITGPGVTNAVTPIAQAYADSVPVLMISSENATDTLGKGYGELHEVSSQQAVTAPVTGFSATAMRVEDVPELLARAFATFSAGRPRPAHVAVPIDILSAPVAADAEWRVSEPARRPAADATAIEQAAARLLSAERPVLCVGGGAIEASRAVTAVAERLGAPVFTSNVSKGVVPDSHPLCLGASLPLPGSQALIAEADVVLAIGTELSWTDTFVPRLPIKGAMVRVDIDPARFHDRYPAEIAVQGDATLVAEALIEALGEGPGNTSAGTQLAATARAANAASLGPLERKHKRVLDALRRALPEDGVLTADATQISYTGQHEFAVERPRTWLYAPGYCTLGGALPGAIGAALACPERKVMAMAGDGGFMFTVQELCVAVELGLSLPIVLWNNDSLGQIRDGMVERGFEPTGVSPRNPDFQALALAFGARAVRPGDVEDLEQAVRDAFDAPVPTLIEIREDDPWLDP